MKKYKVGDKVKVGMKLLNNMSKKHRWKAETETVYGTKPHVCIHCGIRKSWYGGDYQCWYYSWNYQTPAQGGGIYLGRVETFNRPDCKPKHTSE